MPTYLYECECHGEFEVFHGIAISTVNCEVCGQTMKRLINYSNTSIIKNSSDSFSKQDLLRSDSAVAKFVGEERYETLVKPREDHRKQI